MSHAMLTYTTVAVGWLAREKILLDALLVSSCSRRDFVCLYYNALVYE